MKSRAKKIIILLLILTVIVTVFSACKKEEVVDKGYVVITFVTNSEIIIPPIILEGKDVNMPDDPIRAGYNFVGWFYDQLFTAPFDVTKGFTIDTTLYAKWSKKSVKPEEGKVPDDQKDDKGFVYNLLVNDSYEVVSYQGSSEIVTIPDSFKNKVVARIGEGAFRGNQTIKEISFGYEINSIGSEAFRNCPSLEKISPKIGNAHFVAENGVLYNDKKTTIIALCAGKERTSFIIGKSVNKISEYAFSKAKTDIRFEVGSKYGAIESFAFAELEGKLTLGANIIEIRKDSFNGASGEIVFGEDAVIEEITNGAFAFYIGEKIIIPASVKSLSMQPFNNSTALVDLSKSTLNVLGNQAFGSYKGATLVIPVGITALSPNCFYQSTTNVTFETGSLLRTIGEQSFNSFGGHVTFGSGIISVEKYAFYCASKGATITFSDKQSDILIDEDAFKGSKATVAFL